MIAAATYLLPVVLVIVVSEPLRQFFAAVAGCIFVWAVVRSINRRRDPRHAKTPRDTP